MTESHPRLPDQAMVQYVSAHLPRDNSVRDRISERYSRFYAPLAVGSVALAFLPPFDQVDFDQSGARLRNRYGSVFEMASRVGGGAAVIGVVLLIALVALLVVAAFRGGSVALPVSLGFVATLMAVMLIAKPGTSNPTPALSDAGRAGLALAICTVLIALTHAIHLALRRPD